MFSSPSSTSSSEFSSSGSDWSQSSTRSSPVHAASLVDPATHAPALMQLIDIKLDKHVLDYVVDAVAETVDFAMGRTHGPATAHVSRGRSTHSPYLTKFSTFVSTVLTRAEVTPATMLVALVYIARARPHLSIALEEWALERVFLGATIVASKYTNDSTLKNVHWALCTGVFGKRDVGRIEREFLDVLDWQLGVDEADVLAHHEGLMAAAARSSALASRLTAKSSSASLKVKATPAAPAVTQTHLAPPRAHTHHRHLSVPELEPSSPQSSLASLSPRTPLSHLASPSPSRPSHHHSHSKHTMHADVPMDVDAEHEQEPKRGRFHDLLRSFPLPLPRAQGHHRAFPIHVNA
ncbi:hypothetical protein DFH06DRAFT_1075399 [Mycena polygramma]|nr:hypothetical protein DFH06DRAFT_1075399 [Mycena polygramma]